MNELKSIVTPELTIAVVGCVAIISLSFICARNNMGLIFKYKDFKIGLAHNAFN